MDVRFTEQEGSIGPPDGREFPRFMGPSTFARLPRPGPGTPVGRGHRSASPSTSARATGRARGSARSVSGSHRGRSATGTRRSEVAPFGSQQVVDAGDVACSTFVIDDAIDAIERAATELTADGGRLLTLGGDHTIAFPLLRRMHAVHGPVALVHFDAHVDTYDTYMGAPFTHGTPFRRAAEEGLFARDRSMHVGIRGSKYGPEDLREDAAFGFEVLGTWDIDRIGADGYIERIRQRVGDAPMYLSIDIDVLDPAFAPATGTPEAGGFTSRELLAILRGLRGSQLVGADVVEVAPAYDHAEITSIAAANIAYELLSLMALPDG